MKLWHWTAKLVYMFFYSLPSIEPPGYNVDHTLLKTTRLIMASMEEVTVWLILSIFP
jgi:hypothetical protein